jgi:hypothetical protein
MHIYYDGTRIVSRADTTNYGSSRRITLRVVDQWYLDEIRVTKGVGRYATGTITVPTAAFPNS